MSDQTLVEKHHLPSNVMDSCASAPLVYLMEEREIRLRSSFGCVRSTSAAGPVQGEINLKHYYVILEITYLTCSEVKGEVRNFCNSRSSTNCKYCFQLTVFPKHFYDPFNPANICHCLA